jgi:hypothetical protein
MEAGEAKILSVMWGMGKMWDYPLRWYNLNFILQFRVIESSSDQRELAIRIPWGFVWREFPKLLYYEVNSCWGVERVCENLLDRSRIPVTRDLSPWSSADNHITVSDREWVWAEDGTMIAKFFVPSCFCGVLWFIRGYQFLKVLEDIPFKVAFLTLKDLWRMFKESPFNCGVEKPLKLVKIGLQRASHDFAWRDKTLEPLSHAHSLK